jgi:hypothetical protein
MGTRRPRGTGGRAAPARAAGGRAGAAGAALRVSLALLALVAALAGARAAEPPPEPLDRFPSGELAIDSAAGSHAFKVWVAATEPRRNQGLMYVKSLPAGRGMLFLFDAPQTATFWMKNTLIPLDLLFIAPDGRVIRIVENATPLSEATISSMGIVSGVLELAGGASHKLGLRTGDQVRYPAGPAR